MIAQNGNVNQGCDSRRKTESIGQFTASVSARRSQMNSSADMGSSDVRRGFGHRAVRTEQAADEAGTPPLRDSRAIRNRQDRRANIGWIDGHRWLRRKTPAEVTVS